MMFTRILSKNKAPLRPLLRLAAGRRISRQLNISPSRKFSELWFAPQRFLGQGERIKSAHHVAWFSANESSEEKQESQQEVEEVIEVTDTEAEISVESPEPTAVTKEGSASSRHSFQAETSQLLDIVSRSLYTDKEVFIRELISNASDALEKVRHRTVSGEPTEEVEGELRIDIKVDPDNRTFTIQDYGIGLSANELHECLGTIAKSGTKAFMQSMDGDGSANGIGESLIGQFGVGFYSAFMVAEGVDVFTKSANPEEGAHLWRSSGLFRIDLLKLALLIRFSP